jgi:hypothetical protein
MVVDYKELLAALVRKMDKQVEDGGIDPSASYMLSKLCTI